MRMRVSASARATAGACLSRFSLLETKRNYRARTHAMLLITRRKMPDKKERIKKEEEEEETNFWIVSDNTRTCPYKGTKIARRTNFSDYNRRK